MLENHFHPHNHFSEKLPACSVGWWPMAGAGLFREKSTAGWLLVAGLFREKSTAGWWLISQANRVYSHRESNQIDLPNVP
jgi:hypothetical protein